MNLDYILNTRTDGANPFKIYSALSGFDKEAIAFGIRRMPYASFLRSSYWFAVSHVAKSRAEMRCQVCNEPDKIEVHHRTYDRHGYEHLHMIDLTVLCGNCHGLFHGHLPATPTRFSGRATMKAKMPKGFVVPHTEADIQIPDGETIILTKELINACRANGSFTNATLRALGMTKALIKSGWPDRLIGKRMTREEYRQAIEGRFIYKSGHLA